MIIMSSFSTSRYAHESLIERTNIFFGGVQPSGLYRVFFTQGEMDPARTLGPNADLNANSPVTVMSRKRILFSAQF